MKSLLILFSILAAIPIILYPLAWALSITIFDAPNSTQVPWKHLLYYAVLGYPIFIIICIIFAWKFDSIIWAIIGMIPLFCFIPILLPDSAFKERFNNTQKDYICNQETYLNVHVPGNFGSVDVYEKYGLMSYTAGAKIAWIKDDTIRLEKEILNINLKMTPDEYIRTCKDTKGKTLLDKYTIVH